MRCHKANPRLARRISKALFLSVSRQCFDNMKGNQSFWEAWWSKGSKLYLWESWVKAPGQMRKLVKPAYIQDCSIHSDQRLKRTNLCGLQSHESRSIFWLPINTNQYPFLSFNVQWEVSSIAKGVRSLLENTDAFNNLTKELGSMCL
jgi:hypothetical protein